MAAIKFNGQRPYFDCAVLHFLCHLPVLEHLNVFEFYSQYEVINKTRKNEEDLMEMINTQHQHLHLTKRKIGLSRSYMRGRRRSWFTFASMISQTQSHSMVISWTVIRLSMHQWRRTVETCYYCSTPFVLNLI